jgi:hypothetical protein
MNCNRALAPVPVHSVNSAVQAVWDWCWPLRERGWALRGVSSLYLEDSAALCARSDSLLAHSRRFRSRAPSSAFGKSQPFYRPPASAS